MRMNFTVSDLKNSAVAGLNTTVLSELSVNKPKGKSKYGNKTVVYDGMRFHSIGEKDRWVILKLLEKTGEIKDLRRQVKYILEVDNKKIESYIADFTYYDMSGNFVAEDFKGARTSDFKRKKKWMLEFYGIEILET